MLNWKTCVLVAIPVYLARVYYLNTYSTNLSYGTGQMFDSIAGRYDFINRVLALNMDLSWRREMIAKLEMGGDKNIKVLDLATGTADVALLMAKETKNKNLSVLGVDPSMNMIDVGRQKISSRGLSDVIKLEIGDARDLGRLKNKSFDRITMSFGIRNVPERDLVICEMYRVLKRNGGSRIGILEFSEPDENAGVMGYFAKLFIRYAVPLMGAILSGAPREYLHLQNSIKHFPSPSEFRRMMENPKCKKNKNAGFNVEVIQMNFGSVQLYLGTPK